MLLSGIPHIKIIRATTLFITQEREKVNNNEMVDGYNKKYPNRFLPLGHYKEAQASKEKINQQSTKVKEVEGRGKQLSELINSNIAELQTLEQALDKPIEILPSN